MTNFCLECSPFGLASSPALSITAALSHKPPDLRLSARVTLVGGGRHLNTETSRQTCTSTEKHFFSIYFSHHLTRAHTHSFYPSSFQPLSLSPSHTRTQTRHLTSTGIRSFYRVAVCWRGRRCGRAVSPSSDWILDQYPVPRQPASLGWTDCI